MVDVQIILDDMIILSKLFFLVWDFVGVLFDMQVCYLLNCWMGESFNVYGCWLIEQDVLKNWKWIVEGDVVLVYCKCIQVV